MPIRHAGRADLPAIVAIYNASIPGRMATADLAPVDVTSRKAWFAEFDPGRRPLFVSTVDGSQDVAAWLSLRSFYGRPAYEETVEVGLYTAPGAQRQGHGRRLVAHALATAPSLGVTRLLAFTFAHNAPSLALFRGFGFADWGRLPGVATLDGVRRDLVILGYAL
ncbi:MAG TPA: GNAT family N-acetyltransferase [Thermomicrobiales bacterium]|nr:GNAT family N-acetyltransferase [Thermomicrobiales bacterium]